MSDLRLNVAKSKVSIAKFTLLTTFNPTSDIYYLQKINYDSHIFPHYRVRVSLG